MTLVIKYIIPKTMDEAANVRNNDKFSAKIIVRRMDETEAKIVARTFF